MRRDAKVTLGWGPAVIAALGLLVVGAALAWLVLRSSVEPRAGGVTESAPAPAALGTTAPTPTTGPPPDVEIPLTAEAVQRAGIVVSPVTTTAADAILRLPGVVEPNAYRQVVVTPLTSGRVTRVLVELGARVRRGQAMAEVFSPPLAEAQSRFLSLKGEVEAAAQQLRRTERLVEIGAASQQELEQVRAEHQTRSSAAAGARSQLVLLGMNGAAIDRISSAAGMAAALTVPAPIDGVVTERGANVGLNVEPSTPLFTVVDLSTVWIVGDLYEKDFPHVRAGADAVVTTTAYPARRLEGRVSYIDPQVSAATRTARVRVEVPNPRQDLRIGMFAEIEIRKQGGSPVPVVPRGAVQTIGPHHFVYLAPISAPGVFVERAIEIGPGSGEHLQVRAGLAPGDRIVTEGSFFVRAERERLGLRPVTPPGGSVPAAAGAAAASGPSVIPVTVGDAGFEPARIPVAVGSDVVLEFTRTSEKTCATEVLVPSQDARVALPLGRPVRVPIRAAQTGEVTFTCGMGMFKGAVVAQ